MILLVTNSFHKNWVSDSGKFAHELLIHNRQAIIQGRSSRGIFLKINSSWIIFLSLEDKRGPLTLNFQGDFELFNSLDIGIPVNLSQKHLTIPTRNLSISLEKAVIWQSPSLPNENMALDQRLNYLASVYGVLRTLPSESRFIDCLPHFIFEDIPEVSADQGLFLKIAILKEKCQFNQVQGIIQALSSFIGWGNGLTPSGDDLIMGFVLGANRWGKRLIPHLNVEYLNAEIVKQVREHTTLLSANLIECACNGEADERLLNGLDGIIAGTTNPTECVNNLSNWGNTSGIDALMGMALFATSPFSAVMN